MPRNPRVLGLILVAAGALVVVFFLFDQSMTSTGRRDALEDARFRDRPEPATEAADQIPLAQDDYAMPSFEELMAEIDRRELTLDEQLAADLGEELRYVTVAGDTVPDLAAKYLGDAALAPVIYERNPELSTLIDPLPGTRIVIPMIERR